MEKKKGEVMTAKDWWVSSREKEVIIQFRSESFTVRGDWNPGTRKYDSKKAFRVKVLFPQTGSFIFLEGGRFSTPLGISAKAAMEIMVENELIKEANLDWEKTKMFIKANNGKLATPEEVPSNSTVEIIGREIFQDGVMVGKVNKREEENHFSYNIYNKDGKKVITAKIDKVDPFEWALIDSDGDEINILYEEDTEGIKMITYLTKSGVLTK
ncbi:MAG: hypothetical protein JXQ90_01115 [Cyclobacteriaceae bacterium]